jgi:ABC-2 type transport system permease protein
MSAVRQTWQVYLRNLRVLRRQPAYLLITITQPVIWLLLFGALFKAVAHIPGFHGTYINFFTPGVVVMLALFSAGWSGMGFVEDINSGVMDRMLASPVWRGALNPVNWAVVAGRAAAMQKTDWGVVGSRVGMLLALVLVSAFLAQRAFARYQQSL